MATVKKTKKKAKRGPREERLIIRRDPERALRDLLNKKPEKKRKP